MTLDSHTVEPDGSFSGDHAVSWEGSGSTLVTLYALQYATDAGGFPTAYLGLWGHGTVHLSPGVPPPAVTLASLANAPVSSARVTVQVDDLPPGRTVA